METLDNPTRFPGGNSEAQMQIAMRWGLIGGLAGIALQLLWQVAGWTNYANPMDPKHLLLSPLSLAISFGAIAYGIKQYRDEQLQGYISFGPAFMTGFIIATVMALISTLFTVFYMGDIMREVMQEAMQAQLESKGLDEADMEDAMKFSSFATKPWFLGITAFLGGVIWGAIMALIAAAIMKKEVPQG